MAAGFNKNVALRNDRIATLKQPLATLKKGFGFTFIDFLPEKHETGGFFKQATYEDFGILIDRANEFLRINKKWRVVTCESVKFKKKNGIVDSCKMTYKVSEDFHNHYIRGLRLWLTERKDENETVQQIGYFNLIPQRLKKTQIFSKPKFETLDTVIERLNSMLHSNPLPGRIITVESLGMYVKNFEKFDPDHSDWTEKEDDSKRFKRFLFVIRTFYEMDGCSEKKGTPCQTKEKD